MKILDKLAGRTKGTAADSSNSRASDNMTQGVKDADRAYDNADRDIKGTADGKPADSDSGINNADSNISEDKKAKRGLCSVVCVLMLLASFIFINLTAARIPSEYTELDISGKDIFKLSEQTVELVNGLDTDVDIYWLVQSGNENKEIEVLLNRYADLSAHIYVHKTDPIVNPDLVNAFTAENVNDNSLIIAGGNRSRYIDYSDIFAYNHNYFSDEGTSTEFNGEPLITSAIEYIGNGEMPKIYRLTGHNEITLSTAFEDSLENNNFSLESLSLTGRTDIPDDADCLLMAGPKTDITAEEEGLLAAYLESGGKLLIYTDYGYTDMPNLFGLLESYGVSVCDGLVFEADASMYYMNYPMQLMPKLSYHDISSSLIGSGAAVLVPMAHGLKTDNDDARVTVTSLLNTSEEAYAKSGKITQISRTAEDEAGPFSLGVAIEPGANSNNARIVWYSTSELLNKEYDQLVNGADTELAIASLSWLTDRKSSISIPSKTISTESIAVPGGYAAKAGIILICVVPAVYLALGTVISIKRKRR